jgi:hypothetical protein
LFNTLTVDEALKVDAEVLANYFGFDALLPVGRQNTFLNSVRLIQSQLQRLLESGGAAAALSSMTEQLSASCTASQSATATGEVTNNSQTSLSSTDDPRASEVAVLLSGGVDSSVALKLLLDQGHKVRAYYLKIWLEDELAHLNSCPWEEDLRYAQAGEAGQPNCFFCVNFGFWVLVPVLAITGRFPIIPKHHPYVRRNILPLIVPSHSLRPAGRPFRDRLLAARVLAGRGAVHAGGGARWPHAQPRHYV